MSKRDRWLITAAITASIMPLLLMAFIVKLLPVDVPVIEFSARDTEPEFVSRYNNLMAGLFCLAPLSIVLIARFIKGRDAASDITAMLAVSIILGSVFSAVVLFGGLRQLAYVQPTAKFDYIGFLSVAVCLIIAACSNLLRDRQPGDRISVNNKYTRYSVEVWEKVHKDVSTVQAVFFVLIATGMSFLYGFQAFFLLAGAIFLFCVWTYIWSYILSGRFLSAKEDEKKDEDHF